MHKGYAFVQFTNPFDARNACHGEDGRTILSQLLGEYDFDKKFNRNYIWRSNQLSWFLNGHIWFKLRKIII